jgi:hypothetical protein
MVNPSGIRKSITDLKYRRPMMAAFTGFVVARRRRRGTGFASGVVQQRLVGIDQELIEGESARCGLGTQVESRQRRRL